MTCDCAYPQLTTCREQDDCQVIEQMHASAKLRASLRARADMADELAARLRACVPLLEAQLQHFQSSLDGRYRTPALEDAYEALGKYDALKEGE